MTKRDGKLLTTRVFKDGKTEIQVPIRMRTVGLGTILFSIDLKEPIVISASDSDVEKLWTTVSNKLRENYQWKFEDVYEVVIKEPRGFRSHGEKEYHLTLDIKFEPHTIATRSDGTTFWMEHAVGVRDPEAVKARGVQINTRNRVGAKSALDGNHGNFVVAHIPYTPENKALLEAALKQMRESIKKLQDRFMPSNITKSLAEIAGIKLLGPAAGGSDENHG